MREYIERYMIITCRSKLGWVKVIVKRATRLAKLKATKQMKKKQFQDFM